MSDSSKHQSAAAVCEYHRSSHYIQITNNCPCCFFSVRGDATDTHVENSHTDGTTARFKDERMSRWVQICQSRHTNECMWVYVQHIHTLKSLCAEGEGLLQVAVDFEAVVARICNDNMSIRGEGESLRAVQRVCWCVDVGQERTAAIKHLGERNVKSVVCLYLHLG